MFLPRRSIARPPQAYTDSHNYFNIQLLRREKFPTITSSSVGSWEEMRTDLRHTFKGLKSLLMAKNLGCSSRSTSLEDFASELVDHICSFMPGISLKTLRLVSCRYKPHAEKHLFHSLVIWKTTKDWKNLANICRSPHLAPLVQSVYLARIPNLPIYAGVQEWMENANFAFKDTREIDPDDIYHGSLFEAYRAWHAGEEVMDLCLARRFAPRVDLDRLTNCTLVETTNYFDLITFQQINCTSGEAGRHRRERDTCMSDEDEEIPPDNAHWELFLMAADNFGASWTELRLHDVSEVLVNKRTFLDGLHDLQCLMLDLSECSKVFNHRSIFQKPWYIASWVERLLNLRQFTLVQHPLERPSYNMLKAMREVHWPRLREIQLYSVTTTEDDLLTFLHIFCETLESLKIVNPVLRPSNWEEVQRKILSFSNTSHHVLRASDCTLTQAFQPEFSLRDLASYLDVPAWHELSDQLKAYENNMAAVYTEGSQEWNEVTLMLQEIWHNKNTYLP